MIKLTLIFALSIGFAQTAIANPAGIKKEIQIPSWNILRGEWIFSTPNNEWRIESLKKNLKDGKKKLDMLKYKQAQNMPFLTVIHLNDQTE